MNRIWNGFNRVFRLRPPAPSQTTVCSEENDVHDLISTSSDNTNCPLERLYFKNTHKDKRFYHNERNTWQEFQNPIKFLTFWNQFTYYVTALIVLDRSLSWKLLHQKQKRNNLPSSQQFSIKQRLCGKFPNGFTSSTILNVVGQISPDVFLPRSTAHAANKDRISVVDHSQLNKKDKKSLTTIDLDSNASTLPLYISKEEYFQSLLEDYVHSTLKGVGETYNTQGVNSYKSENCKNAFEYFKLGSDKKFTRTEYNLGLCYHHGIGTKKNTQQAVAEYKKASDKGHLEAKYNLATIYLKQNDSQLKIEALALLETAAKGGLVQAQCELGLYFAQAGCNQNLNRAVEMFKMGADNKDPCSTFNLAGCYEHGFGGLKIDYKKAFQLYTLADKQGHIESTFKLGCIYLEKESENALLQAIALFKKAANAGCIEAEKKLKTLQSKEKTLNLKSNPVTLPLLHKPQNCILPGLIKNIKINPQSIISRSSIFDDLSQENSEYNQIKINFHKVPTWPSHFVQ